MHKVSSDFVNQLLETRGWDKAGIRVDERRSVSDKDKKEDEVQEEETEVTNVCPLCEADFGDSELTDEALEEHAISMMGVFSEAGLISEEMEISEDFIIENAGEILDILSEAGLIVESEEE